ncbi:unnamed protein product [Adineta steineri]|uniref:Uncharacterized protein n=1 Tax=Adineta steineri TaxID=433720 RepID=A0A815N548_9BILA|nr:unnamed protein product [Adineta steineri]CAF1624889.1 unnamed protein product [Adineta steineri]
MGNGIGDIGAQHFADGLRRNITLTTLDLSCNQIGDIGAQHLADGLRHNTTLTTLEIWWYMVEAKAKDIIGEFLERNRNRGQ